MTTTITQPAQKDHRPPNCRTHRGRKQPGCKPCRALDAWYNRQRRRGLRNGTWEPLTPAEPVAQHLRELLAAGWTGKQIATRAGIDENVIWGVRDGKRTRGVTAVIAAAILGVTGPAPGRWLVPAVGTRRRIQALGAIGYTRPELAQLIGTTKQVLDDWVTLDRVTATTRDRVTAIYDQLSHQPGTSNRARSRAKKLGYAPPMAWEGVDIDDPAAEPVLDAEPTDPDAFDPITVGLAIDGRLTHAQIAAHKPDLIEAVRRLAATKDDHEIALHLHWPGGTTDAVGQFRRREGIPAKPRTGLAVPYPSTRIRRDRRARQAA